MESCDWSVGQCLQTSNEASTILFTDGFQKFICNVKRKMWKFFVSK